MPGTGLKVCGGMVEVGCSVQLKLKLNNFNNIFIPAVGQRNKKLKKMWEIIGSFCFIKIKMNHGYDVKCLKYSTSCTVLHLCQTLKHVMSLQTMSQ